MKKRVLAAVLGSAMAVSSMSALAVQADEVTEIIWQWPSMGSTGEGFQAVEDALNAMMEPEIGVHVTLNPVSFSDLANDAVLTVSSGEQYDLILSVGTGVGSLVSSGLIEPLDDYIDNEGADIKEICGSALSGGYYDGILYGLPNAYIQGESYGYVARTALLEKYGIEIDEDRLYAPEEFTEIFQTIKDGEGDNFFCLIPEASNEDPLSRDAFEYDKLGATSASGYLMLNEDFTNMTIENVYETEEYAAYAQLMYDWAQKGFISRDAATNTEDRNNLVMSGNYLGYFAWSTPNAEPDMEAKVGEDITTIKVIAPYTAGDRFQNILWSVPITSASPAKAVEALNYIYAHKEAAWLLQYGIEGQDYEITEQTEDGTMIAYLSDNPVTLPYFQPFGVYGNRLEWPLIAPTPIDMNKRLREFSDNIPDSRKSPALGYCFISDPVATEYAAVQTVIAQYLPSINCGTIDPATNLPEFQEALKAAGIEKVIAENQRQLDEWAAANQE